MKEISRRDALAGATALGAVALAGCVANNSDDDENENPESTEDPDPADNTNNTDSSDDPDSSTETTGDSEDDGEQETAGSLELLETGLTTTNAACGSGDLVEADTSDGAVTLEGKIPSSDPCHEAVLEDARLEDGALSVVVGVESTDSGCAQCLGVVEYEGTLSFSQDLSDLSMFESFNVEHRGSSGETHVIEEAGVVTGRVSRQGDQSGGGSGGGRTRNAVLANSIETISRDCSGGVPSRNSPERVEADEETEFSQSGSTVTVEGSVGASTPCHEAFVESVSYNSGVLSVVVGAESNLGQEEFCTECVAEIEYEAAVEVAEDIAVDDVSVTHIEAVQ